MDKSVYRTDAAMEQGYVPNKRLFAYSAAIAGQNMHYAFINGWLFYFCNNILKIKAEYVGYEVLVQGVMDCVLQNGNRITVIDYKTDYVENMGQLKERYEKQAVRQRAACSR